MSLKSKETTRTRCYLVVVGHQSCQRNFTVMPACRRACSYLRVGHFKMINNISREGFKFPPHKNEATSYTKHRPTMGNSLPQHFPHLDRLFNEQKYRASRAASYQLHHIHQIIQSQCDNSLIMPTSSMRWVRECALMQQKSVLNPARTSYAI
jgi:hypothetical protein